jgi:Fic family protein
MNCYYSNLIEGHDTHPRDIDRALHKDYSTEPRKRALQLEAVAHIEVQKAIDEGDDPKDFPASSAYAIWLHREFCRRLPDELLWVEDPETTRRIRLTPGALRDGKSSSVGTCLHRLQRFLSSCSALSTYTARRVSRRCDR